MKTKTIELYEYSELSPEAQKKALSQWREGNDYFFLEYELQEKLHELLGEHGIKDTNDTSKPGTKPTPVYYSLSYCQGDGAMFEGVFEWNGYTVTVKHSGQYYHYNSKDIDMVDEEGNEPETNEPLKSFNELYVSICKELEHQGYAFMEYEDSEEMFVEACEANEYTFTIDGKIENA